LTSSGHSGSAQLYPNFTQAWPYLLFEKTFNVGEPRFVRALDPEKSEKKSFVIGSDGLRLANTLQQKRVAKECSDWIREKVSIKSIKQNFFSLLIV
jgi:hypothetical protein